MARDAQVVAEHLRGWIAEVMYEMLGKGRDLASVLGGRLLAARVGHDLEPIVEALGAAGMAITVDTMELAEPVPDAEEGTAGPASVYPLPRRRRWSAVEATNAARSAKSPSARASFSS